MANGEINMIKDFFGTEERPVGAKELSDFWRSLRDDEKQQLMNDIYDATK